MKSKQNIIKNVVILITLAFSILSTGCITSENGASEIDLKLFDNDASCSISEFNLSLVHNQTPVHVTDEDLQTFPEFSPYLHDVNDNPHAWRGGTRMVKTFACNASRTLEFQKLYRKFPERPKQPVLEHNGHSYDIGFEYLDAHSTARPTANGNVSKS